VADVIAGYIQVGINSEGEVVIVMPQAQLVDENGVGHFVFSVDQAINLATTVLKKAQKAELQQKAAKKGAKSGKDKKATG
jgi:hypothetical protein